MSVPKKFEIDIEFYTKYGNRYCKKVWYTAPELYEWVLKNSQRGDDYNVIDYARKYFEVSNKRGFPRKYYMAILMLILNSYTNKEPIPFLSEDRQNIENCYNSLPNTYESENVKKVKEKYLTAAITTIAIKTDTPAEIRFPIQEQTVYKQKVEEWKKAKFDEYASVDEINIDKLEEDLTADFIKMLKTAEKEGAFEKDYEEYRKEIGKFLDSIKLK